jgi:hypothetical protein
MTIIRNTGNDRVLDALRGTLSHGSKLDAVVPDFSLFGFEALGEELSALAGCRLVVPSETVATPSLVGSDADRSLRNRLQTQWLARECAAWIERCQVRASGAPLPQSLFVSSHPADGSGRAIHGAFALTTDGLGLAPGSRLGLIQGTDTPGEREPLAAWFEEIWDHLPEATDGREALLARLRALAEHSAPALVYHLVLYHLLGGSGELDPERVVRSATGIRDSVTWKALYRFQRDGVVGAIDKLERLGGCILADSVGLGKTFEALAIIKYYELRNHRVLVLCPRRLRDNWTLYKANDRRNSLAADRFGYDVLNHTDLSRDRGHSGDIDLSQVNWGNYDLVVIDESHNFRNKPGRRDRDSRYDRLMERIIRSGVRTRVLMLSATPVNNRLADLKNQIAFITEGHDRALAAHGIPSIEATVRQAQGQFNRWQTLGEEERTSMRLMEMLGFDYFTLLDLLTIARSRKHVERYYGTAETGRFPERLAPVNRKCEVDGAGEFPPVRAINDEIRRLNLAAYAPLRYVLPHRQAEYDRKYSTQVRGGEGFFRQVDREESLVHLLRVNLLKRMESSVTSFALTLQRQLADADALLDRLEAEVETVEEVSIEDVEVDDPEWEPLLIGRKVKVLLRDVDRVRWRQELTEDRNRLHTLLSAARQVAPERDAKLGELRRLISEKCRQPLNPGNRKAIVFTAFADTAEYLYQELAVWARTELGVHAALVTGGGRNRSTLPGVHVDLGSILTAFSPRSKQRPPELAEEGEIDLLIATDCISEGQNLQDCDFLVNYDIHWNPVRIIQRFGRVDRLGSPNRRIQLVNFWPNLELDEYINLEERVSGRMVLLDISATGEENVIEHRPGGQMNDLEYRRRQLERLQEAVVDLEDLSTGLAITDLTLNDFRIDLAEYARTHTSDLETAPPGTFAVTTTHGTGDAAVPPGVVFCLRAAHGAAAAAHDGYPLAPHYLVHVGEEGSVVLPYTQARRVLDTLKKLCIGRDFPDAGACARFDRLTRGGRDMNSVQKQLARAVASVMGKTEERAAASLFRPGGTHALRGEFRGTEDFEVVAFLVVLPEAEDAAA